MSTILKALRRVEGEREQKIETERLHADVTGGTSSERRPPLRGWIRLSLALSLILVVAAGFWSLGSDPSPEETPPVVFESEAAAPGLGAAADRIRSAANPLPSGPSPAPSRPAVARGDRNPSYSPSAVPVPSPSAVPSAVAAAAAPSSSSSAPSPSSAPALAADSTPETPTPSVALTDIDKRRNAAMQEAIRRRSAAAEWAPRAPRYEPPRTFVPAPATESPAPDSPSPVEVTFSEPAPDPTPEELSPYLAAREAARLKAEAKAQAEPIAMAQPKPTPSKPTPSKPMPSKPMPNSQARAASAEAPRVEVSGVETLRVVSTVWHPSPDKRVAVITLSDGGAPVQLRQGETLNGLRVSEIKLSSVVFESGEQTIVRKVGAKP
jgi:hypothetical protein